MEKNHSLQHGQFSDLKTNFQFSITLCCVLRQHTLLSRHSASLHPGVLMGTDKFTSEGSPVMEQHPIQGGEEKLLVASCCRHWDLLQPEGPPGMNTDLTHITTTVNC